mmetsp:Transcript_19405/g.51841  ORF Transcript_19405/g.51841 Transcript_19405/m.51841 type:complete len:670 (+) Transcript_19405:64-2073(+)
MGASLTRTLARVLPEYGPGSDWIKNARGPTLRRLFGAYTNPDLWAAYRRMKKIDSSNSGWLAFEEVQQLLGLPEFNLLFLWDLLSQQNELIHCKELLTTVCIFSSASLPDKGRLLMALYDTSRTGTVTGAEIAQLSVGALGVLARCTGTVVKPKDVASSLRDELPGLLPEYRELLKRKGAKSRTDTERSFQQERFISQQELEKLLPTVQAAYQDLPFAGPPPVGALAAPPLDWGEPALVAAAAEAGREREVVAAPLATPLQATPAPSPAGGGHSAVRAIAALRSSSMPSLGFGAGGGQRLRPLMTETQVMQHIAEQDRAEEEAARKAASDEAELAAKMEEAAKLKVRPPAATGMLVIHGFNLADIEKDMARFRYLFVKGVSAALSIPSGCVEILDITQGSIRLEFRLHASPVGRGDPRDGSQLMSALQEQIVSSSSHFRRGKFAEFAASAELWQDGKPKPQPLGTGRRTVMCDAEEQASDWDFFVKRAWALVEHEMDKCEAAEAALRATNDEFARVEAAIAEIQSAEEERRLKAQRRKEEKEARRRAMEEEEERRRVAGESEAQRKAAEEQEALRKREEEELERQRQEAEEKIAAQRREEERQQAERRKEEEERRLRDEAEAKHLQDEAQRRCAEVTIQVAAPSTHSSMFLLRPDLPLSIGGTPLLTFL